MKLRVLVGLLAIGGVAGAKSAPQKPEAAAAAPVEPVGVLKAQLLGSDEDKAAEAAHKLGESKDPKALDVLLDTLAMGAPPKRAVDMLAALAGKKDARALDVLKHYARNRNVELRKKAVTALGALPDARVVPTLLAALSDPIEEVRAAGAKALGDRHEKSAEAKLIQLLKRRDPAAAAALAQLGTPDLAHRIAEMLGDIPDAMLCTALGDMLKRPDFGPENIRVELVKTLAKVPGLDSTTTLIEYVAATEKDKQRPSRMEAQKIIDQRSTQ